MAPRKKKKHSLKRPKSFPAKQIQLQEMLAKESQAAEFTTVAWLLATVATLFAGILGGVVWLAAPADAEALSLWRFFPRLLLFSALVTGFVGLGLGAVVVRVRVAAPPRGLTVGAAIICLAPWLFLLM